MRPRSLAVSLALVVTAWHAVARAEPPAPYVGRDAVRVHVAAPDYGDASPPWLARAASAAGGVVWEPICMAPCNLAIDPRATYRIQGGEEVHATSTTQPNGTTTVTGSMSASVFDSAPFRVAEGPRTELLRVDPVARSTTTWGAMSLLGGAASAAVGVVALAGALDGSAHDHTTAPGVGVPCPRRGGGPRGARRVARHTADARRRRARPGARPCGLRGRRIVLTHGGTGRAVLRCRVVAFSTDFLVLGSGVAGLTFALDAAAHGKVTVVTKRARDESNTKYAQGGVAAVFGEGDSAEQHVKDTLVAGGGLCHEIVVEICAREGPERVRVLVSRGAKFDGEGGRLSLTREGGHSARRVVHTADATGAEIERALVEAASAHPNIEFLEHHTGVDLIMLSRFGGPEACAGAYVLDEKTRAVSTELARATVLATGGAGKVYLYTTNPDVATGDGVAMAYRAGAEIGNMEFYQFHPTALYHPTARRFLISEAVRGEGGVLRLPDGTAFMADHDPRKDLAPRDVVARAIDFEMKRTGSECVYLDITHRPPEFIREHFPTIAAECLRVGVDMTKEAIPVVPAAHFMCGGITTDLHGRTTIPSLFAIGECAFTGLHGANRLASNSLLEGLIFGHRAALRLASQLDELRAAPVPVVPEWQTGRRRRERRGGRRRATTGTSSVARCGTTSASSARELAPPPRGAPHRAPPGGDPGVLLEAPGDARSLLWKLRNIATRGRAHRERSAASRRESRAAHDDRLPRPGPGARGRAPS